MSTTFPRSDYVQTRGIVFFARMLDKIRLQAAGTLPAGYNLGHCDPTCFDARFCNFWEVDYEAIKARTLAGGSDEEVFAEIFAGRRINPLHVLAFNAFLLKRGWRDEASAELVQDKAAHGMASRDDVQTYVDFHDADEGRPLGGKN